MLTRHQYAYRGQWNAMIRFLKIALNFTDLLGNQDVSVIIWTIWNVDFSGIFGICVCLLERELGGVESRGGGAVR